MLTEKEFGSIYKINNGGGFLNIKEAFVFTVNENGRKKNEVVGKVLFEFGRYESAKNKKLKETISYFFDLEDVSYLAAIIKNERLIKLCASAKKESPYAAGYSAMAGIQTSKMVKIQMGDNAEKFYIKALEGPGEKMPNGLMKPKYNDKTANKKIVITMDYQSLMTMGCQLERAVNVFDHLYLLGEDAVIAFSQRMKFHGQQENGNYNKGTTLHAVPDMKSYDTPPAQRGSVQRDLAEQF